MEMRGGAVSPKSIAGLVLGIVSIAMAMLIALVGLVAGIIGLGLALADRRQGARGGTTTAALACSAAGIVVAAFNYALTFYLLSSGKLAH